MSVKELCDKLGVNVNDLESGLSLSVEKIGKAGEELLETARRLGEADEMAKVGRELEELELSVDGLFTWGDVDAIRWLHRLAASNGGWFVGESAVKYDRLYDLSDRIAALLPPRNP